MILTIRRLRFYVYIVITESSLFKGFNSGTTKFVFPVLARFYSNIAVCEYNSKMLDSNSRILVPFDATELSIRALEEAKEVALKSSSMITLLYVIDDTCFSPPGIKDYIEHIKDFDSSKQNYLNVLSRGAELMINRKVKEMNQQGINAKFSVKIGNPADEIIAVARDERSDLIIMGSSGSLKKLHERKGIGSVSRWVSEMAECPVSLIR